MDKTKIDPSNKDCAYCESSGAKLTCGACKAAHYCSKACQKLHWKNGHKEKCIAPEKRRPQAPSTSSVGPAPESAKEDESNECPICLDVLSQGTLCTLPCQHDFHRECVEELRKHGVLQACPLCRADLPAGPQKLFEDATRVFSALRHKVGRGKASWRTLTASQKKLMADVLAMWTAAAHQGLAQAQFNLGAIYHHGQGVKRDFDEAAKWYRLAAHQGMIEAQVNLGSMYDHGQGVKQNFKEAAKYYRKAAGQGDVQAQFNLGLMYENGQGIKQDFKEAAKWFRQAADQGDSWAQYNLGVMYLHGQGVKQDPKESIKLFRKAAEQGHANAQHNLNALTGMGNEASTDTGHGGSK